MGTGLAYRSRLYVELYNLSFHNIETKRLKNRV